MTKRSSTTSLNRKQEEAEAEEAAVLKFESVSFVSSFLLFVFTLSLSSQYLANIFTRFYSSNPMKLQCYSLQQVYFKVTTEFRAEHTESEELMSIPFPPV